MDYRKIIDSFRAGQFSREDIQHHLSELMLFMDFSASLNSAGSVEEIANLLLLTLMGYTRARRSVFFICQGSRLELIDCKGTCPAMEQMECSWTPPFEPHLISTKNEESPLLCALQENGFQLVLPIHKEDRLIAVVAVGAKTELQPRSMQLVMSLCQMTADALENARTRQALQVVNRELTLKVYQLKTLFELSKDFNAVWDSEAIFRILGSTLIGQLLISRCAVLTKGGPGLEQKFIRGFRWQEDELDLIRQFSLENLFDAKFQPLVGAKCSMPDVNAFMESHRVHVIFPMVLNNEIRGLIFLGDKRNRKSFEQEDFDLITTLGNLALVADENARMQQEMIEKQRMERELAIARQIQHGLLPQFVPKIRGYEITSIFEPCYTVGGDYFDFVPVSENQLAIAIGDVSGKSTPAALLMASLQASLRALSSVEVTEPTVMIQRLNQLLCDSQSQTTSKYVTFFYAILNDLTGELQYVNAGHCYPLALKTNGEVHRLDVGGTVLGFFRDAKYRKGVYNVDPGDVLVLYTDGVTELTDAREEEFGVERLIQTIHEHRNEPVGAIQSALQRALAGFQSPQGQCDDITFILLKRQSL